MTETIDLHVDSIAAGGDGVGRHEGIVVFVPRTAPGDRVRVRAERRDRLMRGQLLEVLEPSTLRIEPPCPHYIVDRCGGCQLQHVSYDEQIAAKAGIIRDALTRIGRVRVDAPPMEPSDRPWRYRRKLTLALRRRDGRWIAGLHRYDEPDRLFELRDCLITEEPVLATWKVVLGHSSLLPDAPTLRAAIRTLPDGFSLVVEGGKRWDRAEELFVKVPPLTELWWVPDAQRKRLLHSRSAGNTGASFTQVNAGVACKLREWVVSLTTAHAPRTVVDAYAGTGDLAVALASERVRVTAIEIDRDAARLCGTRLPAGSRSVAAAVEHALPDALPADVVILNPPRAGVDARVTDVLDRHLPRPRSIVYVSCNPATLARDVRRLPAYRVESLRGFDMFPQTAHVETVCQLVPAA